VLLLAAGLALAGSAGYLTSQAIGVGSAGPPTQTTTVNVGEGATGPQGPPGPPGPQGDPGPAGTGGAESCPAGSTFKAVVLNSPGGHVEIWTCVKD
jgi:hypothetical protein